MSHSTGSLLGSFSGATVICTVFALACEVDLALTFGKLGCRFVHGDSSTLEDLGMHIGFIHHFATQQAKLTADKSCASFLHVRTAGSTQSVGHHKDAEVRCICTCTRER